MTTASHPLRRPRGGRALVVAGAVAVAATLVLVGLAALVDGSTAAAGAAVGAAITWLIFAFGAFVVHAVAGALPAASLLIAMLTYLLQVLAVALFFFALEDSGAFDSDLARGWVAAGVVVLTLTWTIGQLVATTRLRIPAFELPDASEGDR